MPDEATGTPECPYVGRGGLKLQHALRAFRLDVEGLTCADFGCNIGGFTDCLLRAGATRVYAIDTGYGALDYRLRKDPRVVVMERTNALHVEPPDGGVDFIAVDLAWTPQRLAVPAALRWMLGDGAGRIVTLIKPHYEAEKLGLGELLRDGVLAESDAERVVERVRDEMPGLGATVAGITKSPIVGGGKKGGSAARGNAEWLALLIPGSSARGPAPH